MQETWLPSPNGEDTLEKEMATYSSILAWIILWTGEPGGPQPRGHKQQNDKTTTKYLLPGCISTHASSRPKKMQQSNIDSLQPYRITFTKLHFNVLYNQNPLVNYIACGSNSREKNAFYRFKGLQQKRQDKTIQQKSSGALKYLKYLLSGC